MALKSDITSIVTKIEETVGDLPDHVQDARAAVQDLGNRATQLVRKHPGLAVIGAFGIGFLLARAARHA